jgi:hypothetical protein
MNWKASLNQKVIAFFVERPSPWKIFFSVSDFLNQNSRQSAKDLLFVAKKTLLAFRIGNFDECLLLKKSSTYNVAKPWEAHSQRRRPAESDAWILPVGSIVSYRTQALIGYGVTSSRFYGAVIGWTVTDGSTGRSITYQILPITQPTPVDVGANPDLYYRTQDLVAAVMEMNWISKIPDEDEIWTILLSDDFQAHFDPFFDRLEGHFLIPTADFAQLYPDDQAARSRLRLKTEI